MRTRRLTICLIILLIVFSSVLVSVGKEAVNGTENVDYWGTNVSHGGTTANWVYNANGSPSSPTVVNGTVYIGTFSGDYWEVSRNILSEDGYEYTRNHQATLYALNSSSGSPEWEFSTQGSIWSSPTYENNTVYVGTLSGSMYAVNSSSGEMRWGLETGHPIFSSPVVSENSVYFGNRGYNTSVSSPETEYFLYNINADNGTLRWKKETGQGMFGSPAVDNGTLYVGDQNGTVYAVDSTDGEVKWQFRISENRVSERGSREEFKFVSSLTVSNGTVYVPSYRTVYAIDAGTGEERWNTTITGLVTSSPAVAGGSVYIGDYVGNFHAIEVGMGEVRWTNSVSETYISQSSPFVVDGTVVFGGVDGDLYGLDNEDGRELWSYETTAPVLSSPAVVDGMVYFSNTEAIYALTKSDMKDSTNNSTEVTRDRLPSGNLTEKNDTQEFIRSEENDGEGGDDSEQEGPTYLLIPLFSGLALVGLIGFLYFRYA